MPDGWWLFAESRDAERTWQPSPNLSWRQWQSLLADSGFRRANCASGESFLSGQVVLIGNLSPLHYRTTYVPKVHGVQALHATSAPETSTMDPQQRQLLELGYEALHGAGWSRSELAEANTSVFVGVMSTEFREALPHSNAYAMTGTGH
eukprot:1809995-Prymnesium_polylepis.1